MWHWRTRARLDDANGRASLVTECRAAGINEVYLAVDRGILADARLPDLVLALGSAGIRVEALMGEAAWYEPTKRAGMLELIDAVGRYDAQVRAPAARFAAVHLDIEPHQLPENKGNRRYFPALLDTLNEARERAALRGLDTAADLPRFVLRSTEGAAFARAVPRVFVMLYELPDKSGAALARASGQTIDEAYAGALPGRVGTIVVGLSVDDYPVELEDRLRTVDSENERRPRYGGWAIHDEARYRARRR